VSRHLDDAPPILTDKHHAAPSIFTADGLLREARRQKALPLATVPSVCALDPDGDLVRRLIAEGAARRDSTWACYHTELYRLEREDGDVGLIGGAVGAPFAVLVAEQLFASGCRFLVSVTSAGQLMPRRPPPYFVLVERALRDEGTSYHYLPPGAFSMAAPDLLTLMDGAFDGLGIPIERGATWTTDAPFRETAEAVAAARARGLLAVEMEAAALYAFAAARGKAVLCLAHVTNQMAQVADDFEKGEAAGTGGTLALILAAARRFLERTTEHR
jgi:uridine phosphorylase